MASKTTTAPCSRSGLPERTSRIPNDHVNKPSTRNCNSCSGYHLLADKSHAPMPRSTINFDTVRKIGLTLPGVEASTAWGAPALKVRGKLLACVPTHRTAEPNSLVVRVDFDDRAELLAAAH